MMKRANPRGRPGTQMSGLPVEHAKSLEGKPLCGAKERRWGSLFTDYQEDVTCRRCQKKLAEGAPTLTKKRPPTQHNPLAYVRVTEEGHRFESGVPVTFPFFHNSLHAPYFDETYQQGIEPAGRYMLLRNKLVASPLQPGWTGGTITFHKPLVLAFNTNPDGGYDSTSWKAQLTRAYGLKGRWLSKALLREGIDGIVTVQLDSRGRPMHTKEIVDLSVLRSRNLKR